jgi:hypothetical protein
MEKPILRWSCWLGIASLVIAVVWRAFFESEEKEGTDSAGRATRISVLDASSRCSYQPSRSCEADRCTLSFGGELKTEFPVIVFVEG